MENENKKGLNVPPLRFPGFEGEWRKTEIANIISNKSAKYIPNTLEHILDIELENMNEGGGITTNLSDSANQRSTKNCFYIGNVLFGKLRPYLNKIWLASKKGVCSSEIWVLSSDTLVPSFLYSFCQTSHFSHLANTTCGSKMPRADWDLISSSLINYPSMAEQKKIGNLLIILEKRICLQRKTIEDLKKERLYYLFNFIEQAFKTYPLIRLDLITSESNEKSTVESQYRIISSTGKGIFFQDQYFNKQASSESNIGYKILPYGYCTYRPMSDTGSFTFNIQKLCSMSIVSPAYPVFKFINYDSTVALAIMNNSDQFKKKMLKVKEGGTRFALPFSKLKWLSIPKIPLNKQTKITHLLNIIDRRNEIYDMQLRYLLSIKEYLLKNLFI